MSAQSPTSMFSSLYPRETAELHAIFKQHSVATSSAAAVIDFPVRLAESARLQDDLAAFVRRSRMRAGGPVSLSATLHLLLTAVGGPQVMQYGPEIDRPTALIESFLETVDGWPELSFAPFEDAPAEQAAPPAASAAPPRPIRSIAASLASHSALNDAPWSDRTGNSLSEIARALGRLEASYQRTALRLDTIDQRLADVDGHLLGAAPTGSPVEVSGSQDAAGANPPPTLKPAAPPPARSGFEFPDWSSASLAPAPASTASDAPGESQAPAARLEPLSPNPAALPSSAPGSPASAVPPQTSWPSTQQTSSAPSPNGSFSSANAQVRREDLRTAGYARFDSPSPELAQAAPSASPELPSELTPHLLHEEPLKTTHPASGQLPAASVPATAPKEAIAAWAELFASPPQPRRSVSVRAFVILAAVLLLIAAGVALYLRLHNALPGVTPAAPAAADNVDAAPSLPVPESSAPAPSTAAPATARSEPGKAGTGNRVLGARETFKPSVTEEVPPAQPAFVAASTMDGRLIYAPRPQQPHGPGLTGLSGMVVMEVIIDPAGTVDDVRVLGGQRQLRDAAINAVRNWRYRPVERDGRNVPVRTIVRLDFNRNGNVTRSN